MARRKITIDAKQLAVMWREYSAARATATRLENALCEHYAPLAEINAAKVRHGKPRKVRYDDLVCGAMERLLKVVRSFDPERGVKFETFAALQLRGGALDAIRLAAPKGTRRLQQQLSPIVAPKTEQLDLPVEDPHKPGKSTSGAAMIPDRRQSREAALGREILVHRMFRGLPIDQQIVLYSEFILGRSQAETGVFLCVSASRVSQLRAAAMKQLQLLPPVPAVEAFERLA